MESGNEGEVTDESIARKRKPNFSMNEISVITENIKNRSVCGGKIGSPSTKVSLCQKRCHGNTENTSMPCYCHIM